MGEHMRMCLFIWFGLGWFYGVNDTSNNISLISWRSVLLVMETGVDRENHRPVASHWQALSRNVVHLALRRIRIHNIIGTYCIGSCKSNYHMITTTTASILPIETWRTFILNYYEQCVFRIEYIMKQIYIILLNKF